MIIFIKLNIFNFLKNILLFSILAEPICIPINNELSPTLFWCINESRSERHAVIAHCGFNLLSLMTSDVELLLICLLAIYIYVLLGEVTIHVLCPFFNWIMFCCYVSSYCILVINLIRGIICKYLLPFSRLPFWKIHAPQQCSLQHYSQ